MATKKTHGGAGRGQGRKPKPEHLKSEPTTTKRIPNSLLPSVEKQIARHKKKAAKKLNQEH